MVGTGLLFLVGLKLAATAAPFGSGAVGGVFTRLILAQTEHSKPVVDAAFLVPAPVRPA